MSLPTELSFCLCLFMFCVYVCLWGFFWCVYVCGADGRKELQTLVLGLQGMFPWSDLKFRASARGSPFKALDRHGLES